MSRNTLNYEAVINGESFQFHGDSPGLAQDHIEHHARCIRDRGTPITECRYRKIGNVRWIPLVFMHAVKI